MGKDTVVEFYRLEQRRDLSTAMLRLEGDPQDIYENLDCARGEMENLIKETRLGLFADRTRCQVFAANPFRLSRSSLAYMLTKRLRALALPAPSLHSSRPRRSAQRPSKSAPSFCETPGARARCSVPPIRNPAALRQRRNRACHWPSSCPRKKQDTASAHLSEQY